jgi:putative transcriptional regulator
MTGSNPGVWVGLVPLRPEGRTVRLFEASLVRSFRIREGLTQQELATAVGASRGTIAAIERRRSVPSVSLALAIADRLGATVEELFAPDDLR